MNTNNYMAILALAVVFGLGAAGCDFNDGPIETTGEKVDNTVEKAGDKLDEAGDKVKDSVDQ